MGDIGGRRVNKQYMLRQSRKNASRKHVGKVEKERGKQNIIMDSYISIETRSQRMPLKTNKPGSKRLNMKEIQNKNLHELGLDKVFLNTKSIIQK